MKNITLICEDSSLKIGLDILKSDTNFNLTHSGYKITASKGDNLQLNIKEDICEITYSKKVEFYRAIGLFLAYCEEMPKKIEETASFEMNGIMIDCSRNAVFKVDTIKLMLRKMALAGLNTVMLYTEDTFTLENNPYFGYCRGAYTDSELKELDDYAYNLGIEMIPCVQTLSHLELYLQWPCANDIKDTDTTLNVGAAQTYDFIEQIIKKFRSLLRTDKIHIGLDEAEDMGKGFYYDKFGAFDRTQLMKNHIKKVDDIVKKYNYKAMMWSDMHMLNITKQPLLDGYYPTDIDIVPKEILDSASPDTGLVYWDYYHDNRAHYEKQLSLHKQFEAETIFAGGIWTWTGPCADYNKTIECTPPALEECIAQNIKKVFATIWFDDGAETALVSSILGLWIFAETDYNAKYDLDIIIKRFEAINKENAKSFIDIGLFNNIEGMKFTHRCGNPSKALLYEDPLLKMFEKDFEGVNFADHYEKLKVIFDDYCKNTSELNDMWEFYKFFAKVLKLKAQWRDAASLAIRQKDRQTAKDVLVNLAGANIHAIEQLHNSMKKLWFKYNKNFGFEVIDMRLGSLRARFVTAKEQMLCFANNEIDDIPELSQEKLNVIKNEKGQIECVSKYHLMVTPAKK